MSPRIENEATALSLSAAAALPLLRPWVRMAANGTITSRRRRERLIISATHPFKVAQSASSEAGSAVSHLLQCNPSRLSSCASRCRKNRDELPAGAGLHLDP